MEHLIDELNSINTSWASFDADMDYTMDLVKTRFASLKMDGRPVEVIPYPRNNSLKVLTNALLYLEPDFDPGMKRKSQLRRMLLIKEFLAKPEHFCLTDYTLQFRLCGKERCGICVRIGRIIQTSNIDVGGYNPCEELFRWIYCPVNYPMEKYHFLTLEKGRTLIDANSN